ncbi:SnoaL-like domain-containing protein [Nannocystis exedens]|uniref:SnoaL-like domain-containing protein n=1 Tax=Nannocystis exedens TaxID=54 RepID=A0A1I1X2U8_9BACT|nr:nuclear transport factor 2 family protein [Nannocystis exedens]PCC70844.1 SnoaL-like domain protein [Nannocystis exedens]SFE01561.1 SnoaL-like domain-containing protein [Nannocystis exedens]
MNSDLDATTNARETVIEFEAAWQRGDYAAVRRLLADDVTFIGPFETCKSADAYVASLARAGERLERIEVRKIFADGGDVAVFCDLVMKAPLPTSFVARWYTVEAGKIRMARVVFDGRPFVSAAPARS